MAKFGTIIFALNEENQMVRFLGTVEAIDKIEAREILSNGRGYEKLQCDVADETTNKFTQLQKLN